MPYPSGHRERVRTDILRSARRLFNRHGYDAVSVDEIMKDAGLTRGAFYFYFGSKSQLYREAIGFVLADHPASRWAAEDAPASPAVQLVNAYLSVRHLEEIDESCPLVTHAAEAARGDPELRAAFSSVLRALVRTIGQECSDAHDPDGDALVIAALCVGGLALARGVGDPALAHRLLATSRSAVSRFAGWEGKLGPLPERECMERSSAASG